MTKQKFKIYLIVQKSGSTNMFDINRVVMLSMGRLTREDCKDIIKNYEKYSKQYNLTTEDV